MKFYCEKLVCTFTETETLLSTSKKVGNRRVDGIILVRGSVPDHVNLSKHSIFFSLDFRWDETHPPCEKEFTLLSLLTQTLVSSRNILSDAPKLLFSNIHGEPVIQLSWLIKRLRQWLTVVGGHLFIPSCPDQEIITQIIICNTV